LRVKVYVVVNSLCAGSLHGNVLVFSFIGNVHDKIFAIKYWSVYFCAYSDLLTNEPSACHLFEVPGAEWTANDASIRSVTISYYSIIRPLTLGVTAPY